MTAFWVWVACLMFIPLGIGIAFGFTWGLRYNQSKVRRLQAEIDARNNEHDNAIQAAKFRIRTSDVDPARQAKVRTARLRAFRTKTPPPRK